MLRLITNHYNVCYFILLVCVEKCRSETKNMFTQNSIGFQMTQLFQLTFFMNRLVDFILPLKKKDVMKTVFYIWEVHCINET